MCLQDVDSWDPTRVGVLGIYVLVTIVACQRMFMAVRAPFVNRQVKEVSEAYMEALIPEPSPANIQKYVLFFRFLYIMA